jgi:uncharacterized protein GlcG (DUF336 family)
MSIELAKGLAEAAKAHGRSLGHNAMIVAVVDDGGHLVYLERMDGVSPGTIDVAVLKARSSAMFRRESKAFEDTVASGLIGLVSIPGMAAFEGAVPVLAEGDVIGAIAVSGLTKELDGTIAAAAAAAVDNLLTD